jgi:hypothetical protein
MFVHSENSVASKTELFTTGTRKLWQILFILVRPKDRKESFAKLLAKIKKQTHFLGKELIAYGSKESRIWVEEMLDQEKNLV